MSFVADASGLRMAGQQVEAAGARLMSTMAAALRVIAEEAAAAATEEMKSVTPVAEEKSSAYPTRGGFVMQELRNKAGTLRDSTKPVIENGPAASIITIIQDAKTEPDDDGRWGGTLYGAILRSGRGPVRPVFKRALAGAGFGPRMYSRSVPPDPYPQEALGPIQTATAEIARTYTHDVLQMLFRRG